MALEGQFLQNVVVLRHGDRIDHADPSWTSSAARPWDPYLTEGGKMRAFSTGRKLRANLDFPIHRVFTSPFTRCIETTNEVVAALCAINDDGSQVTGDNLEIDPSKLKVSIEYGLCEFLSTEAIKTELLPKDGKFVYEMSKLEEMLPAGTVDSSVEHVYQGMPKWGESKTDVRDRYQGIIKALAEKYPHENLLLVTHAEALVVAISALLENVAVSGVEYCAYLHSRRLSSTSESQPVLNPKEFELCGDSGMHYSPVDTS
ncbi:uncharacterized protein LOC122061086 [Macadamia integrifolia]|uniref:uncharacterized protein LOC122061086 n=1 Tax=Macadamia integrifolia TaxID=60698 RepID=UPI001C533580|nr:uncharacterized protein LOC122061086 [Macadamia integrifolia]